MTDHYVKSCFTDHCSLFFIKCITDCEKPKLFCFDKSFDFFVVAHPCVFELFTISPIDKTNCRKVHYSRKPDVDQIFQKRFHYTCWIASADTGNHWRFFNLREHSVCKLQYYIISIAVRHKTCKGTVTIHTIEARVVNTY